MKKPNILIPTLPEEQYYTIEDHIIVFCVPKASRSGNVTVGLYGTPDGLRSLGEFLIGLSKLDQSTIPDLNCHPDTGFHVHLARGYALHEKSLRLDIGRLDAKSDGSIQGMLDALEYRTK